MHEDVNMRGGFRIRFWVENLDWGFGFCLGIFEDVKINVERVVFCVKC